MSVTIENLNNTASNNLNRRIDDTEESVINAQLNLLKNIALQEGFTDYEINKSQLGNGGNYFGFLYTAIIDSKKLNDPHQIWLFIKVAAERTRKTFPVHEMYCNEVFVYKVLSPLYTEMQIHENIAADERYPFAKFYGSIEENIEIIALENLACRGYTVHDNFQCITVNYAETAVKNLAKFHALSYILERRDPKFFNEFIRFRKGSAYTDYDGPKRMKKQQAMITESAVENLKNSEHSEKIRNFCEDLCANVCKYVKINKYPVLCHGDYKASNLMVRYEDGRITSAVAIDYQLIHYGSPLYDLFYFVFGATDSKFRALHLDYVIQFYYESLEMCLKLFSYKIEDIYPKAEFEADVKGHMMIGLLVAVNVLPFILVTEEQAPDLKNVNESSFEKAMRCPNEIFLERYNGIVEDFIRWKYIL